LHLILLKSRSTLFFR